MFYLKLSTELKQFEHRTHTVGLKTLKNCLKSNTSFAKNAKVGKIRVVRD